MTEVDHASLFQSSLGDRWPALPPALRELHSVQDKENFSGFAEVMRGHSIIARITAWVFGFPSAGENIPITVTITRTNKGEIWERDFAGCVFRSYCTPSPRTYCYRERFGLFTFEQDLPVENSRIHFRVRRGWFLGIPIPRFLLPGSDSSEFDIDGTFHFDVAVSAPLGTGLIVRYRGALTPDRVRGVAPPVPRTSSVVDLEVEAIDMNLNMRTSNGTR